VRFGPHTPIKAGTGPRFCRACGQAWVIAVIVLAAAAAAAFTLPRPRRENELTVLGG
jgi:hypothetical protein